MNQKERLAQLTEIRDPEIRMARILADRVIAKAILKLGTIAGSDGYTPVKGKDYFTKQEIDSIVSYIKTQVVKHGKDGARGLKGDPGEKGNNGETPIKGIHYWTPEDKLEIYTYINKIIPKPKDGISPKTEDIVAEFKKNPIEYKDIKGTPDFKDLPALIAFLKAGGFRGGGSSTVSAGGFTTLLPTETPDGNRTVFTFLTATAQPTFIVSDNAQMRAVTKSGGVNWTWNNGTKQATMTIPPTDDIIGIQ